MSKHTYLFTLVLFFNITRMNVLIWLWTYLYLVFRRLFLPIYFPDLETAKTFGDPCFEEKKSQKLAAKKQYFQLSWSCKKEMIHNVRCRVAPFFNAPPTCHLKAGNKVAQLEVCSIIKLLSLIRACATGVSPQTKHCCRLIQNCATRNVGPFLSKLRDSR